MSYGVFLGLYVYDNERVLKTENNPISGKFNTKSAQWMRYAPPSPITQSYLMIAHVKVTFLISTGHIYPLNPFCFKQSNNIVESDVFLLFSARIGK